MDRPFFLRQGIRNAQGLWLLGVFAFSWGSQVQAQAQNSGARNTRSEIQAEIAEADKIIKSPGYSSRLKQIKRQEVVLLRSRLEDGDIQPGDQILLSVDGETELSKVFTVNPARAIALPGVADISLRGVLRSELPEYITEQLKRYLRNPVVHVQTTVRLSILGAVGKPGFYQVESELMVSDAIMRAGGPNSGVDPSKAQVERGGAVILDREAFADAIAKGRTLDQMNLRAGDEIVLGGRTAGHGSVIGTTLPILTGVASLTFMMIQILR